MANLPAQEFDRILVMRLSSLGDILLAAPALRSLRSRFPTARVDFLTSPPYTDLVAALPGTDCVLEFDKKGGIGGGVQWQLRLLRTRYSVIVDLQNDWRSALWRVFSFPALWVKARRYRFRRFLLIHFRKNFYSRVLPVPLRYLAALSSLGCRDNGGGLELRIPENILLQMQQKLGSEGIAGKQAIILCPGSRHATKRWPLEKWVELARALLDRDYQILLLGDDTDRELTEWIANEVMDKRVFLLTDLDLLHAAALAKLGACLVSNDSGLMHLAAAVGTPVVALFGPTVEEFGFFPFRAQAEIVQKDLPCRPCSAHGSEQCPEGHFRCMLDISVDEVLAAGLKLLQHANTTPANPNR
ncbi:MAG: lipopolysaccharide heptosyltransferase II [bacterium]